MLIGKLLSDNFYWRALAAHPDDLSDLDKLPVVTLDASVIRKDSNGKCILQVTLQNSSAKIALMAHLQLRRQHSRKESCRFIIPTTIFPWFQMEKDHHDRSFFERSERRSTNDSCRWLEHRCKTFCFKRRADQAQRRITGKSLAYHRLAYD